MPTCENCHIHWVDADIFWSKCPQCRAPIGCLSRLVALVLTGLIILVAGMVSYHSGCFRAGNNQNSLPDNPPGKDAGGKANLMPPNPGGNNPSGREVGGTANLMPPNPGKPDRLPLQPTVNLSGRWAGNLTQNGSNLLYTLVCTMDQQGQSVAGTARIDAPAALKANASMKLEGAVDGNTFQFIETTFLENHSTDMVRFVLMKGTMNWDGDALVLQGQWQSIPPGTGGQLALKKQ
jgi:hypothetical protein